ncbi:hypothetical protein [Paenibacillus sp. BAC0078]
MKILQNPVMWLSIKMFRQRWVTFVFYSIILISLLQSQAYLNFIVLLPYFCFLAVLKMLCTDYLRGHEETLVVLGYSIEKIVGKTVQAAMLCSFCMSIGTTLIALAVMEFTGHNLILKPVDLLFIGGLYVSLFPVGRLILMRTLLQKRMGKIWNYLIEIGYVLVIMLLYLLLPVSYCLIFFILTSILILGFQQQFLPKQEWNRFFEGSMR